MRKRALRDGLALTELGLGAAQFGSLYRETTEDEAESAANAAWSAGIYNSGLLAVDRPGSDAKYNFIAAPHRLVERADRLADVCERRGVTLPQAALAYPLLHPTVVSVVVGMRTGTQVDGNVDRHTKQGPPHSGPTSWAMF